MMRRPAKFRGRPRMKLYYMRICTGIGCRNVRDPQTGQESPLMYQEVRRAFAFRAARCMPRPASNLGIVIDRSNTAAQAGVGFDSSRDVSLRCFDRCH
jgi:hypothetical protein